MSCENYQFIHTSSSTFQPRNSKILKISFSLNRNNDRFLIIKDSGETILKKIILII